MFDYKKNDKGNRTLEFTIVVPKKTIGEYYEKSFQKVREGFQTEGFRKGKVPVAIARKNIKKETVYEHMFQTLLPDVYEFILKKEDLKPVVNPKVELLKARDGEDWEIRITVALKPEIRIGDYKKAVGAVKAEQKKDEIWVPGKEKEESKEDSEAKKIALLNKILDAILKTSEIEIPELILEEELNRRLTQLVDDVRKIGMTIEDYVRSKNTTIEKLKETYTKEIRETYKLELALEEIAGSAQITVEKTDLEMIFKNITDEKAKAEAEKNAYYYASILKRQKTLDYLLSL